MEILLLVEAPIPLQARFQAILNKKYLRCGNIFFVGGSTDPLSQPGFQAITCKKYQPQQKVFTMWKYFLLDGAPIPSPSPDPRPYKKYLRCGNTSC